jgi:competence protein ComEC
VLTLGILWLAVRPRQAVRSVLVLHARTEQMLGVVERHLRATKGRRRP